MGGVLGVQDEVMAPQCHRRHNADEHLVQMYEDGQHHDGVGGEFDEANVLLVENSKEKGGERRKQARQEKLAKEMVSSS